MVMNKPSALTQQQQQQQKLAATTTTTTIDINNMKLPPFLKKLQMILESVPAHVAGWDETGKVFEVLNVPLFAAELKKHFKGNEQTFIRQLHFYGFSKLDSTRNHRLANNSKLQLPEASPGAWSFSHPLLLRDSPDLFWNIQRQGEKKEPDGFEEIKSLRASVKTLESVVAQLSTKLSMVMNLLESKGIELETSTSPAVGQKRARKMDQVIDVKLSQPAKSADDLLLPFKASEAEPLVRSKAASSSFTMSDEDDDDDDFDTNDTFPYDSSIFELSTPPAAFEDGVFSITEEEVDSSSIDFMTDSMIQDDLKIESVTDMMTKQLSFDSALVEPIHLSRQSSWKNDTNNNNNNNNNNSSSSSSSNSSSSDNNKKKNTNKQGSSRFSLSSSSVAATTTPTGTTDPASMAKVVLYLRAAIAAASSAPSSSTEASSTVVGPNSTPVNMKSAVSVSKENYASSNNNDDNSSSNNNNSGSVSKLADSNNNNNTSSSNVGPQELLLPLLLSLPQIQSALSTIEASSAKSITSSSGASLLASSGWMKPTMEIPA